MCGITGIMNFERSAPVSGPVVEKMCSAIRHRGPDDQGVVALGPVALGSRRLSIIDLNTGHQPIHNEDESVWVAFNGEIFNFQELRRELEKQGHKFYTKTDTEVIVHLYEQYGIDFVQKLRGFFGIALWDAKINQLLLIRDRLGIKPLYYWKQNDRLLFGSELKCILQAPGPKPTVSLEAVNHYISLAYVPDPDSVFVEINKLPPGHLLVVRGNDVKLKKYWELPLPDEANAPTEDECCERLRDLLTESVRLRLVSDVPLGALLSGGLDSSTVVALMAKLMDRPVKTFSIGFKEGSLSELPYARMIAEKYGTEHHELVVEPQEVQLIEHLVGFFDEPFGDASAVPTYLVSQLARQSVTVALSGDGGDELFAGYTRYAEAERQQAFDAIPRPLRRHLLRPLSEALPHGAYGKRYSRRLGLDNGIERYMDAVTLSMLTKQDLVSEEFRSHIQTFDSGELLKRYIPNGRPLHLLDKLLYLDTKTELAGDILTKVDRMSMAHSLEVRVPILDHVFVEYVAGLPLRYKLNGNVSKYIFRKAFGSLLPEQLLTRPKQGFGIPLDRWFAGKMHDYLREVIFDRQAMQRGYFRKSYLERLVREHSSGRRDHGRLLWSLMALEIWHRTFGVNASETMVARA